MTENGKMVTMYNTPATRGGKPVAPDHSTQPKSDDPEKLCNKGVDGGWDYGVQNLLSVSAVRETVGRIILTALVLLC